MLLGKIVLRSPCVNYPAQGEIFTAKGTERNHVGCNRASEQGLSVEDVPDLLLRPLLPQHCPAKGEAAIVYDKQPSERRSRRFSSPPDRQHPTYKRIKPLQSRTTARSDHYQLNPPPRHFTNVQAKLST